MKCFFYVMIFLFPFWIGSQEQALPENDVFSRKKVIVTSVAIGGTWTGSMIGLYQMWYKNETKGKFTFEDDSHLWLQMDKAGHAYTSWMIGQFTGNLYKSSGLNNTQSALLGGAIGLGYQTTFEIFDGYSQGYGFSWSDMAANTAGSLLYTGQQLAFKDQPLKLKFSYSPSPYAVYRPEVLGNSTLSRLFKDYNGQTYWISFSPTSFIPNSKIPKWLCFSFGYSADQKLKGDQNFYTTTLTTGETLKFNARREYLISLDIDLSKLPVRKVWLKKTLEQLNLIKIPLPTLRFNNGVTYGHFLYF